MVLFFCRSDDLVHSPGEAAIVSQRLLHVLFAAVLTASHGIYILLRPANVI